MHKMVGNVDLLLLKWVSSSEYNNKVNKKFKSFSYFTFINQIEMLC